MRWQFIRFAAAFTALLCCTGSVAAQAVRPAPAVPDATLLRVLEAEDQRRWDAQLFSGLFGNAQPAVRRRAALAAGRIGDPRAVALLSTRLSSDASDDVRAMAAFALGEIESDLGAKVLLDVLRVSTSADVRGRALEALGKIGAAMATPADMKTRIGDAMVATLAEERRRTNPNRQIILLGLTAAFRARAQDTPGTIALFLDSADARIRADALNALARLRVPESLPRVRMLLESDPDPLVRANAARVISAATDAASFDLVVRILSSDPDSRVRVSAIRALAALNDKRAADPLMTRGEALLAALRPARTTGVRNPASINELLEIATALGRLLTTTDDARAVRLLRQLRLDAPPAPEVDIALARIGPAAYVNPLLLRNNLGAPWPQLAAIAQALGEIAGLMDLPPLVRSAAEMRVRSILGAPNTPLMAVPDLLRALQAYSAADLAVVVRAYLQAPDVIVRATAAEVLGALPPDTTNTQALIAALPRALGDGMNDAALAIVGALQPQTAPEAADALRQAMMSGNYLIRQRAADALRTRSGGVEAPSAGLAETRDRRAIYQRAIARSSRQVQAVVTTEKGVITLDLLPGDAPLTVDNFIELALLKHFDGLTFHRIVSNFVVQGGDPRGDGSGGPEYQIRCEINMVPHDTGVLSMALSGKDTGGSQVFITHSPQPHLDGGYTVFGRVVSGQDVIDSLVRTDRITSMAIVETPR